MRLGLYRPRPPFPFTPGYELSGVIEAIGNDVTGFEVGQRVVAAMRNGGQSSHVTAPISRVIPVPDNIGLDEAAAMPVYLPDSTSHAALPWAFGKRANRPYPRRCRRRGYGCIAIMSMVRYR